MNTVFSIGPWLALMLLASGAGVALVGAWPWAPGARKAGVALAAGLAAGPLLAGVVVTGVLWALPGAAAAAQAACVFGLLALVAGAGWATGSVRATFIPAAQLVPRSPAAVLTCGFFVAMLLDCAFVPLMQNDALEYATAARILFDARDLAAYPALQPTQHASGFYGPWTHPPLYVALLALGYALQGGSESTLLMRLVAPWALAGAAACVAALARWANPARPSAGALAALLLVSTPMLYLGAASALIDALPVLGLALALAALAGLTGAWWQRALGLGVTLGLALWTHSQAVLVPLLLVPLLVFTEPTGGRLRWGARLLHALRVGGPALLVAFAVGGAPYWRNVALFGSPISDNPIVFALPSLDWPGYFQVQRGLASPAELVQYGMLKPWFAVEAYAAVFWLALLVFAHRRQPLALHADEARRVEPLALGVIGLYLAGAVLSVVLGIDLMVRNERYMLILLPAAAMLAATALAWPGGWPAGWALLRGAVIAVIGLQLLVLVVYRAGQLNAERGAKGSARIERWPPHAAVMHLKRHTPASSLVLSMKPADMFYAGRTMLSYLDPRLVPFYAEREPAAAAAQLRALGVTHVHLPDYWLPPVYHSALQALLADPRLAELTFEANGYQIFRLHDEVAAPAPAATPAAACGEARTFAQWKQAREFVLGGRKNLLRLKLATQPWPEGQASRSWNPTPLFLRETNTVLLAEAELPRAATGPKASGALNEWRLELELEGQGYVQVQVQPRGTGAAPRLVADRPLGRSDARVGGGDAAPPALPTSLQRRLLIDANEQRLDLRIEHRAASHVQVRSARLVPVCRP
jgi:hypothetical protein